jgi:glycosyltransferase involved in cell wall biosynthesis
LASIGSVRGPFRGPAAEARKLGARGLGRCRSSFPAEDKASIFAACDVYAMSSITDSFGQTYLEAWLSGRPVIGARIPAIECVFEHGVDGLLVAPQSAPALAGALVALLAAARRRAAMGVAGRAKTLARFTWDRVTDRVEAAYRETLHQGRRSTARAGEREIP